MNSQIICIDPGPVIQLTAFPRNTAIKTIWERWERDEKLICAPENLFFDVTNILTTYISQGLLSAMTVQTILQAARSLPIRLVDEPAVHIRALELSERFNLPIGCDPHYVAMADILDKELWTYDKRLALAVNTPGIAPRVRWIGKKQELVTI